MISYINFNTFRRSFEVPRSRRLVTVRKCLSDDKAYIRDSRCGLDGKYPQQEESVLLQLEQKRHRSTSIGQSFKRRNVEHLDETLPVSSVSTNSSLPEQDSRAASGGDYNGSTILARKDMVLGLSEDGSPCKEVTCSKELDSGLEVRETSTECSIPKASRCSTYWQGFGMGEVLSEQTKSLVESSWRGSTESQYSSNWNSWLKWTASEGISPTSPSLSQIMEYFSYLYYELKREYRTINTHRSALSSTLAPIDGFPIGQHPLIIRQLKGIFNLRPPQITLFPTWSVKNVLDMLEKWGPSSILCFKLLTYRTVMLLALSSAKRLASLALLIVKEGYLELGEQKVVLQPCGLEKHSRPGFEGGPIEIEAFTASINICPVINLKEYLARTRALRQSESLFVTLLEPHKAAAVATIAGWLKSVITQSGQQGTAGSTRSVSTSNALSKSVTLEKVMKSGDWVRASTFRQFYYKPVPVTLQSANLDNK